MIDHPPHQRSEASKAIDPEKDAAAAAAIAKVVIRQADSLHEIEQLRDVMAATWGLEVVPPRNLLRALSMAGSTLLIACRDGLAIGFALGFVGWNSGLHLHSHEVGVQESDRAGGVGFALKLAQREMCLDHGISRMQWTFDPMLAANARFNLIKLGGEVTGFFPNLYGQRTDAFNSGDITDRVEISWQLDRPVGGHQITDSNLSRSLVTLTSEAVVRSTSTPEDGATISIPPNYHLIRQTDLKSANQWRSAVSSALSDVLARDDLAIAGFGPSGYVVRSRQTMVAR